LYQRLKFVQTAAALNGVPSWNLMPRFRKNVYVFPSRAIFQRVASSGLIVVLPGTSWTRPS
jgi:hypothetical protein